MEKNDAAVLEAKREAVLQILNWIYEIFDFYDWNHEDNKKDSVILILEAMGFERLFLTFIVAMASMSAGLEDEKRGLLQRSLLVYSEQPDIKLGAIDLLALVNLNLVARSIKVDVMDIERMIKDHAKNLTTEQIKAVLFVIAYSISFVPESKGREAEVSLFAKGISILNGQGNQIPLIFQPA
jgi:hypothetical protein